MPDLPDLLQLLARRAPLLDVLRDGALSKRDLASRRDVSRSTIDRAVRELETAGLVTRDQGAIELTLPGAIALESHQRHASELDGIVESYEVLSTYDHDLEIAPAVFRDALIVPPDRHAPHRPVDALIEMLEGAESIRLYATGIMPEYVETYQSRVMDGTELDLICTEHVLQELLESYDDNLDEAMQTGRVTLHESAESLPFSIVIAEKEEQTRACLMLYREHAVAGFIRNDAPDAVSWATNRFEALKADAERVTPAVDMN